MCDRDVGVLQVPMLEAAGVTSTANSKRSSNSQQRASEPPPPPPDLPAVCVTLGCVTCLTLLPVMHEGDT
jgi:hypothetical protein